LTEKGEDIEAQVNELGKKPLVSLERSFGWEELDHYGIS